MPRSLSAMGEAFPANCATGEWARRGGRCTGSGDELAPARSSLPRASHTLHQRARACGRGAASEEALWQRQRAKAKVLTLRVQRGWGARGGPGEAGSGPRCGCPRFSEGGSRALWRCAPRRPAVRRLRQRRRADGARADPRRRAASRGARTWSNAAPRAGVLSAGRALAREGVVGGCRSAERLAAAGSIGTGRGAGERKMARTPPRSGRPARDRRRRSLPEGPHSRPLPGHRAAALRPPAVAREPRRRAAGPALGVRGGARGDDGPQRLGRAPRKGAQRSTHGENPGASSGAGHSAPLRDAGALPRSDPARSRGPRWVRESGWPFRWAARPLTGAGDGELGVRSPRPRRGLGAPRGAPSSPRPGASSTAIRTFGPPRPSRSATRAALEVLARRHHPDEPTALVARAGGAGGRRAVRPPVGGGRRSLRARGSCWRRARSERAAAALSNGREGGGIGHRRACRPAT